MEESCNFSEILGDLRLSPAGGIRFTNISKLRESAQGVVYTADLFDRKIALKTSKREEGKAARNQGALYREFSLLQPLSSPYIVTVWQMVNVPELGDCIAMEYVDGTCLGQWLRTKPSRAKRRRVLNELMEAIGYLHQKQLVHADLKPDNIMITHNGEHVKLIDFGLSDQDALFQHNIGYTEQWAAPEQLERGETDCRTDIYALGKLINLLFPHGYRVIAKRCLLTNKDMRYSSVAELQEGIERTEYLMRIGLFVVLAAIALTLFNIGKAPAPLPARSTATNAPVYDENGILRAYDEPNYKRPDFWTDETTPVPKMVREADRLLEENLAFHRARLAEMQHPYKEFAILRISYAQDLFAADYDAHSQQLSVQYEPERNGYYSRCHKQLYDALQKEIAPYPLFHEEYARGTISDSLFKVLLRDLDIEYTNNQ